MTSCPKLHNSITKEQPKKLGLNNMYYIFIIADNVQY